MAVGVESFAGEGGEVDLEHSLVSLVSHFSSPQRNWRQRKSRKGIRTHPFNRAIGINTPGITRLAYERRRLERALRNRGRAGCAVPVVVRSPVAVRVR